MTTLISIKNVQHTLLGLLFFGCLTFVDQAISAPNTVTTKPLNLNAQYNIQNSIDINQVKSPLLLFKQTGSNRFTAAPTLSTDVNIDVQGLVANGVVNQVFHNQSANWQHATYVFPLPENAAINHLKIKLSDREIIAQIQEKKKAKRTFNQAKTSGKKAALLVQIRPNLFTLNIANIPPHEKISVELRYFQHVDYQAPQFSLHFPMAITPRYLPKNIPFTPAPSLPNMAYHAYATDETNHVSNNPINFTLTLNSGSALKSIKSLHHRVQINQLKPGVFTLHLGQENLNQDFELVWQYKLDNLPQVINFQDNYKNNRYGLLMILPPLPTLTSTDKHPREFTLVLDKSGSMAGQAMDDAKQAAVYALSTLTSQDYFQLITFNNQASAFFEQPVIANDQNKSTAINFINGLNANGGTEIKTALALALKQDLKQEENNNEKNSLNLQQVVFLTDGAVGNEGEIFQDIQKNIGEKRLFTVGLGSAPNRYFMKKAATAGRGSYQFIGNKNQLNQSMKKLFTKLSHPVFTNIKLALPQQQLQTAPFPIPDSYHGEALFISYLLTEKNEQAINKSSIAAQLTATLAQKHWQMPLTLTPNNNANPVISTANFTDTIPALATLWANKKVDDYYQQLMLFRDPNAKQAIINLGLDFHLVTPFTSLVAVDNKPTRPKNALTANKQLKNHLPAGQKLPNTALNLDWQLKIALLILILSAFYCLIEYFLFNKKQTDTTKGANHEC